jgi:hypothetical protein
MGTIAYLILFIAVFPALWLLAAYLDRVWPSDLNRAIRKASQRKEDQEQRVAMKDFHPPDERG